jgi:hypothetical protein
MWHRFGTYLRKQLAAHRKLDQVLAKLRLAKSSFVRPASFSS